jgi:hypothetical protein
MRKERAIDTKDRTWTAVVLSLALALTVALAPASRAGEDDDGDEEIPFDVASVFFELNDTDGDLGIHALVDGEPWKRLAIETPRERQNLAIRLHGSLRAQGLTELFFESAEPTFDELDPERFFKRFPEGEYEVEGTTIEGEELESTSIVTHLIPAPAGNLAVNGEPVPEDCDEGPVPVVAPPFVITWDAVTLSHPELGRTDEPIEVVNYEVVLEREEPTELTYTIVVEPGVTEVTIPAGLTASGEEIKIEVLAEESSGNQTAVESCFEVE